MSAALKVPVPMTVDEFLNWNSGDGLPWQLVNGEPQAMAPTNRTHGSIQTRLSRLIDAHLDQGGGVCTLVTAPGVVPQMLSRINMRVPDLAVTCSSYEHEESALTDPVLIIEILSPSHAAETWANVSMYTSIPSVREILVVRSDAIGCALLRRREDGTWPPDPETIGEGDLVLDSIGFRVKLRDIYATTRLARAQVSGGASR